MTARVWDRFLSERDRAVAARRRSRPASANRPALLMIDLYRWVFGDEPQALEQAAVRWPGTCGLAAWEALPALQQLLAEARRRSVPVIHTTGLASPGSSDASSGRIEGSDGLAGRLAHRYDIIEQVAPTENELVVRKSTPSPFWSFDLAGYLRQLGVDTLFVAGESTSGCVRATVVDGFSNGFQVIVVEDAVFDRTEASHAINLFDMHQKYATVLPLAETLQLLDAASPAGSG